MYKRRRLADDSATYVFYSDSRYYTTPFEYTPSEDDERFAEWLNSALNEPAIIDYLFGTNTDGSPALKIKIQSCKSTFQFFEEGHSAKRIEILMDAKWTNSLGLKVLDNNAPFKIKCSVQFHTYLKEWYVYWLHIDLDKAANWNTSEISIEMSLQMRRKNLEILKTFLWNFKMKTTASGPLSLRGYPESGKNVSTILLLGTAGSGKSTLQEKLGEEGYFSLIDESNFTDPMITGIPLGLEYNSTYLSGYEYQILEFPHYFLDSLRTLLFQSSTEEFKNRFSIRSNINNIENSLSSMLSQTIVKNGSLFQILVSSLSYYKFIPFGQYNTKEVEDVELILDKLKSPSEETVIEILNFAEDIGLNYLIKLLLNACGSPEAIIFTLIDREFKDKNLSTLPNEEIDRRFTALKFDPWIEMWYRIIGIIISRLYDDETKVINYDYTQDEKAEDLLKELSEVEFRNDGKLKESISIHTLEKNPLAILHFGKLKEERLLEIMQNFKQNNKFQRFIEILNKLLESYEIIEIDLKIGQFPIITPDKPHLVYLSNLINAIQKFTWEM